MADTIWWIRRDLRLSDNQALGAAIENGDKVTPVFILDPKLVNSPNVGPQRLDFLYESLKYLNDHLLKKGSHLTIRIGDPFVELGTLLQQTGASSIFAEADVSTYARRRDAAIRQQYPLHLVGSPTVYPPGLVVKPDGTPYTIFTPFSRAWKAVPFLGYPNEAPDRIATPEGISSNEIPAVRNSKSLLNWPASEQEALIRLNKFAHGFDSPIYQYSEMRDLMAEPGTSLLSPYLRFGLISSRQAVWAAKLAIEEARDPIARQNAETWLNELIWREFFANILYHFPYINKASFRPKLRHIPWQNDESQFKAWCEGRTGYPVVDAGMRQLSQIGWMHNRARMIVASFLTKDLLIDWRWGEKWFMQNLVDGDPAANNGGWQWAAGTGTDAAPYFRIFNPVSQGMKFDPQGHYIRHWIPELECIPLEFIHEPWKMPLQVQQDASCKIGVDYPVPIVDHQLARQRALVVYARAKT